MAERGEVNAPIPMNYKFISVCWVGALWDGIAVPYEACIKPIL